MNDAIDLCVKRRDPVGFEFLVEVQRAFESEERWSSLIVVMDVAGFFVPDKHVFVYSMAGVGVTVVAVLVAFIQVLIWSRRNG